MKRAITPLLALLLGACAASPSHRLLSSGHQSKAGSTGSASENNGSHSVALSSHKYVLPNGLTLIVHQSHRAPLISLDVWYHVGSKDETQGQQGFAKIFGQLLLDESVSGRGENVHPLEAVGATDLGGSVNRDRTELHMTLPSSALDLGLWLVARRMTGLPDNVNQAVLDAQRQVIVSEKQEHDSRPYGDVPAIIAGGTYPAGHPYSWTPLGTTGGLPAVTVQDARAWFARYFDPANATLVVVGDVDADAVKAKVERYFGSLPSGETVGHVTRWVARMGGERRRTVVESVRQPRMYMVWNVTPAFDADTQRLRLAAAVLADGKDSLLFKRLVYHDHLATDMSAHVAEREIGSQFVVTVDGRPGVSMKKLQRATEQVLAKLLADGPSEDQLTRVRPDLLAHFQRSVQSLSGQAKMLADSEVFAGSPDAGSQQFAVLRSADADQVRDAARDWLSDGVFILDVLPGKTHHGRNAIDDGQPPTVGMAPALKLPPLQATALPNGMVVLLAQRDNAPLVDFDLVVGGGRASNIDLPDGTAALAFDLLGTGAADDNAAAISRSLQTLGATFDTHIGLDSGDVHFSALKARLPDSLDLFAKIIEQPTFPKAEVDLYKEKLATAIAQQRAAPMGIVRRVITPLLFGIDHPYAHVGLGLRDEVQEIQRQDLVAYAKRWLRPDNATLLVTGDVDMATLKPLVESRFGSWNASPIPLTQLQIPKASRQQDERIELVNKPGATQSLIVAADLAPPPSDADEPALRVARTAVGNRLASELGLNLEQPGSEANGIFARLLPASRQQVFYVGAVVPANQTATTIQAIQQKLQDVVGIKPLTLQEVAAAKQSQALSLPASVETLHGLAAYYERMLAVGLPEDAIERPVQHIEALTAEQVQNAARNLIHPAALTWIVVGDRSKVATAIRALKLGPLQAIDADGNPASSPDQ